MSAVAYGSQPFQQQIDYFRGKVNLPTRTWHDIWQGQHARAFVIAGATKDELLSDFRSAIDKAIAEGATLAEFRKDFDKIVAKHGWSYNGGRGWRTAVIYDTNLRTSYQAGRWEQIQRVKQSRPYLEYVHDDSVEHPREEHKAWDGTILPVDHPFWLTHYTPNGWGCKCKTVSRSVRDLQRLGKTVSEKAPPMEMETRKVGNESVRVPKGIDPGWAYNPGRAAWGQQSSEKLIAEYQGGKGWKRLTPGDWRSHNRPEQVPLSASGTLGPRIGTKGAAVDAIRKVLNGDLNVFETKVKGFTYPVYVDAETLGNHLDLSRTPFIPLLPQLLTKPFEIWQTFEESKTTGKVALRHRYIQAVDTGDGKGMMLVADAQSGRMIAWTLLPMDVRRLNAKRVGKLVYGKK